MNTLAEDLDEFASGNAGGRRFIRRLRRDRGIDTDEATCWFVDVEQSYRKEGTREVTHVDTETVWLGSSPADAVSFAKMYADARGARRDGVGRWTLEVFGDGVSAPRLLVVYPCLDVRQ